MGCMALDRFLVSGANLLPVPAANITAINVLPRVKNIILELFYMGQLNLTGPNAQNNKNPFPQTRI